MLSHTRRWMGLGSVVVAALLGTVVLAEARDDEPTSATREDSAPAGLVARPVAATVEPELAKHFGVLRRARTASDKLSLSGRTVVNDKDIPNAAGSNADLARDSGVLSGDRRIFVVPGNGRICLVLDAKSERDGEIAGGGCADADEAVAGRFVRSGYGPNLAGGADNVLVYGLVPDDVAAVKVYDAKDRARNVAVKGNVYAATFPDAGPLRVEVGDESFVAP